MAQRGMLPKIRKTSAGSAPPLARPSIRPVAARKPPPPPAPPRKFPSGVTTRGEHTYDEDGDPATMAIAHRVQNLSFDEETQMRPVDDDLLARSREDATLAAEEAPVTVPHFPQLQPLPQQDIFESLPSLEVRRPFDTYEAEFSERDPATQLHAARHLYERQVDRRSEPSMPEQAPQGEGSGARERPRRYAAPVPVYEDSVESYRPQYEPEHEPSVEVSEPIIPPAPRVPDGFIVGVQPIRTPPGGALFPAHDAFAHHTPAPAAPPTVAASPRAMHTTPYPPAQQPSHYPQQPYPHHQQQQQQQQAYAASAYASGPHGALVPTQPPARAPMQPVGHMLQSQPPPSSSSRTLRFAWFVFGVAFGIGFTFFASGVIPGPKREAPAATFPPAPPVPTQVAQPVQPPPPTAQPAPPPVMATATAPAPAAPPVLAPPAMAVAPAPPTTNVAPPAPAPQPAAQAKAPPPPAPKVAAAPRTAPRRPAPQTQSAAPKALPNSGSVDSDSLSSEASASAPSKPAATASADIPKDLFGAALNP